MLDSPEVVTVYGPNGIILQDTYEIVSEVHDVDAFPNPISQQPEWEFNPTVRKPTRPARPGVKPKFRVQVAANPESSNRLKQDVCPELRKVMDTVLKGNYASSDTDLDPWDPDNASW